MPARSRPCDGCGTAFIPRGPQLYCNLQCRPRCEATGCEKPMHRRKMCHYHYMRWWRTGDPLTPTVRFRLDDPGRPRCSIDGCEKPFHGRGLCDRHLQTLYRKGDPTDLQYEWAEQTPCKVCGDREPGRFRQFCSTTCWHAWRNYDGQVPLGKPCASCGDWLEFLTTDSAGRKGYRAHSYCKPCKRRYKSHYMSVVELALRDGPYCGLCGCDVDMDATRPDFMCPSVDHITPRSAGGTDDPENLQLAHLRCNVQKGSRIASVPALTG